VTVAAASTRTFFEQYVDVAIDVRLQHAIAVAVHIGGIAPKVVGIKAHRYESVAAHGLDAQELKLGSQVTRRHARGVAVARRLQARNCDCRQNSD